MRNTIILTGLTIGMLGGIAPDAVAQHGGRGAISIGYSSGGYGRPGYSNYGHYGYSGVRSSIQIGIGTGYGGYGYAPRYAYPATGYYGTPALNYYAAPTYLAPMTYSAAVQPTLPAPDAPAAESALVTVLVPTGDAQVWFGATLMSQPGTERVFYSPPLEVGKAFSYTITARWTAAGRAVERTRQIEVRAGQRALADFRDPPLDAIPAPEEIRPK